MPGGLDEQEVVGFGSDRVRTATRAGLARRHPWVAGGLAVLVVAAAGAVVVHQRSGGPRAPVLVASPTSAPTDADGETQSQWSAGLDGRPAGPITVEVRSSLAFRQVPRGGFAVLGLVGPGLPEPTSPVARLAAGATNARATFNSTVDCGAALLPARPGAYRLRVALADGTRTTARTIDAGTLGTSWGADVATACGSWLARRDLTVTSATATTDPLLPKAALVLTVTNNGRYDAVVDLADLDQSLRVTATPAGPLRVPAHGSARVSLAVDLRRCDSVAANPATGLDPPAATTQDLLGLLANVGSAPDVANATPWITGGGPTGIVLSAPAATVVNGALKKACGDIGGFAVLIPTGGASYDRATRLLTVRVAVDGTPGRIKDLQLVSERTAPDPSALRPLWSRTARVVPDRTGQAVVTVRYRSPRASVCPGSGAQVPGFTVLARVDVPAGVRTLRFAQFVDPWQDPVVLRQLCPNDPSLG